MQKEIFLNLNPNLTGKGLANEISDYLLNRGGKSKKGMARIIEVKPLMDDDDPNARKIGDEISVEFVPE